jgi:hypothetical protein
MQHLATRLDRCRVDEDRSHYCGNFALVEPGVHTTTPHKNIARY